MERRYQKFCVSTCIDRIRPILYCLYIPIMGTMRLWILAHYVLYNPTSGAAELMLESIRLAFLMLLIILLSKKWGTASNYSRGVAILWIARIGSTMAFLQQLAVGENRDLQVLASLVGYVCVGGFVFPTFSEYILFVVPLSFLRPIYLSLSHRAAVSHFDVLYQHMLILALGTSITWTIHADHRRDWLRSRTVDARINQIASQPRPTATKVAKLLNKSTERTTLSAAEKELGGTSDLLCERLTNGRFAGKWANSPENLEQAFQVRGPGIHFTVHASKEQYICQSRQLHYHRQVWHSFYTHTCCPSAGACRGCSAAGGAT